MFGESFRAISLAPLAVAVVVLFLFVHAAQLDREHEYYLHLSSVFFVDTSKPVAVTLMQKLHAVFIEMHHPQTTMTEILKGQDPSIILVNISTSLLDPTAALAGGGELAVADGPAGLVAGRDKVGAAGRKDIVEELGVKQEASTLQEIEDLEQVGEQASKTQNGASDGVSAPFGVGVTAAALPSSLPLERLATRALEWQSWSRGWLFWNLFQKYQPLLAIRFPSLRLGSAIRAVYTGLTITGMCFVNALLFEYSGPGMPKDPRCEDAGDLSFWLFIINALVSILAKVGVLTVIIALVSKEVCYEYDDEQRQKKVLQWIRKERLGIFFGALYVIATSWYVAIFIFMTPSYTTWSFLQATVAAVLVIELLKPLLQALILTSILKSKYSVSFVAHFPQLSDFSHLHVMDDAEFTHAHWAELSRVLNSSLEEEEEKSATKSGENINLNSTSQSTSGEDPLPLAPESGPDRLATDGGADILSAHDNHEVSAPMICTPTAVISGLPLQDDAVDLIWYGGSAPLPGALPLVTPVAPLLV
jgi:hypothetical protein